MSTINWIGGPTGKWSDVSNWQGNVLPTANDDVRTTDGTITIDTAAVAKSFTGNAVTLNISGSFTLSGDIETGFVRDVNGNFTRGPINLLNGNLTYQNSSASIIGTGIVNRTGFDPNNQQTVKAKGGILVFHDTAQFGGNYQPQFSADNNSTIEIDSPIAPNNSIVVQFAQNSIIKLDQARTFAGVIGGVDTSTTLDLVGISPSDVSIHGFDILIAGATPPAGGVPGITVQPFGPSTILTAQLASDGNGGTNVTWTAPGAPWKSGVTGNWSTASNWVAGSIPVSTADITIINGIANVTGSQQAKSLTSYNSTINVSGSLTLTGSIDVFSNSRIALQGGSLELEKYNDSGQGFPPSVGQIIGYGDLTFHSQAARQFSIAANNGVLKVHYSGASFDQPTFEIRGLGYQVQPATLELMTASASDVVFNGTGAVLKLDNPSGYTGHITSTQLNNALDLANTSVRSASYDGTTLSVVKTDNSVLNYSVSGVAASTRLGVVSDQNGGTAIIFGNPTPPINANPIPDQTASKGGLFNYTFAKDVFVEFNPLVTFNYTATKADGSPLPNWLSFNPATRTFVGTPSINDVGSISVKITATDSFGVSTPDIFNINISNNNHAPVIANPIANQTAQRGSLFNFAVGTNVFSDQDEGDILTYTATKSDGSALPSWLTFNPSTKVLSGTPGKSDIGSLSLKLIATDTSHASVSDTFTVTVSDTTTVSLAPTNDPTPSTAPKQALFVLASGVDDTGNAHGNYYDTSLGIHGYVVSNGSFQTIDVPFASTEAGKGTTVAAVTPDGLVWGSYKDNSGISHGFVKYLSQYYQIDAPAGTYGTWLTAGNAMQAAGTYVDAKGIGHGYIETFSSSGPQFLTVDDPAGAKGTWLTGLSNNGQATGFYIDANGSYHGFAYQAGQYAHLNVPSAISTIPESINSNGQIVGAYINTKGWHGFIYSNGTFTPYDYANASLTAMTGINDHGDVIGVATVGNNNISFSTHILG